jgi:predicted CXXCH cytochrome family protein
MSARRARMLALLVAGLLAIASPASASDPPHWEGAVETTDCVSNCHVSHNALGGGLNPHTGNTNLCLSCHTSNNLPIGSGDKIRRTARWPPRTLRWSCG